MSGIGACSKGKQASAPPRLAFGSKLRRESDARIRRIGCRWNLWHVVLYAGYSSGAANEPHGITLLSVLSSGIGAGGAVGDSSADIEAQSVVDSEAVPPHTTRNAAHDEEEGGVCEGE